MSTQMKANGLMLIVTMFWGLSYTFMIIGAETMSTFNIVAQRCLLAFIVAGIIFYQRMIKVTVKTLQYAFIQGFLLFIVFAFSLIGLETTSAANAGFILSLTVVMVPIMASIIDKKLPTRAIGFAVAFTLIGIAILTLKGSLSIQPGDFYMVLAALAYSTYLILNGRFTTRVDSITYGVYQLGFAGLIALALCIVYETPQLPQTSNEWIAILGLGIVCSAFCFITQAVVQQHTSPTHTGLIFSAEPIFAAAFAALFLHEAITIQIIVGGSFILVGNLAAQFEQFHLLRALNKTNDHEMHT